MHADELTSQVEAQGKAIKSAICSLRHCLHQPRQEPAPLLADCSGAGSTPRQGWIDATRSGNGDAAAAAAAGGSTVAAAAAGPIVTAAPPDAVPAAAAAAGAEVAAPLASSFAFQELLQSRRLVDLALHKHQELFGRSSSSEAAGAATEDAAAEDAAAEDASAASAEDARHASTGNHAVQEPVGTPVAQQSADVDRELAVVGGEELRVQLLKQAPALKPAVVRGAGPRARLIGTNKAGADGPIKTAAASSSSSSSSSSGGVAGAAGGALVPANSTRSVRPPPAAASSARPHQLAGAAANSDSPGRTSSRAISSLVSHSGRTAAVKARAAVGSVPVG